MWFVGQSINLVGGTIKCQVQGATMEFTETTKGKPSLRLGWIQLSDTREDRENSHWRCVKESSAKEVTYLLMFTKPLTFQILDLNLSDLKFLSVCPAGYEV